MGYEPSMIEQKEFDYSPLGKILSKFDVFESFYKMFISLKSLDAKKENNDSKFEVLNTAFNLYDKLIKEYKKVYEREPKDDKTYGWK